MEDHAYLAVCGCLFNLFTATIHIAGRSCNRNLRTRHAVVTGTHIHGKCPQLFAGMTAGNIIVLYRLLSDIYWSCFDVNERGKRGTEKKENVEQNINGYSV
jgi:hypothetical protein